MKKVAAAILVDVHANHSNNNYHTRNYRITARHLCIVMKIELIMMNQSLPLKGLSLMKLKVQRS